MEYKVYIRFIEEDGNNWNDSYDIDIPDGTKEDDLMSALMDSTREVLNKENEGNDSWENGEITWTLVDYESF